MTLADFKQSVGGRDSGVQLFPRIREIVVQGGDGRRADQPEDTGEFLETAGIFRRIEPKKHLQQGFDGLGSAQLPERPPSMNGPMPGSFNRFFVGGPPFCDLDQCRHVVPAQPELPHVVRFSLVPIRLIERRAYGG
jgi:hypothetical protein